MLDRQRGKYIFECDSCGEVLETDTTDFNEARRISNDSDWHARKFGDDWQHGCSSCGGPGQQPRERERRMI
jgi:hypothetical protein